MTKETTLKFLFGGAGFAVAIALMTVAISKSSSEEAVAQALKSDTNIAGVTQTSEEAPSAVDPVLSEMIVVEDPFGGQDSVGMSLLTAQKDPYSDIVSVMDFTMSGGEVTEYSGDFANGYVGQTTMDSPNAIVVAHRFRYEGDSVFAWDAAPADSGFRWEQTPSRQDIPFGSKVLVTYSYTPGESEWIGSVSIEKPQL